METISQALKDTVRNNKHIKNVYFNEAGDHFFSAHEIEVHKVDDDGVSIEVKKVKSLPGAKLGIVKIKEKTRLGMNLISKKVNVEYVPIDKTMTREEILSCKSVSILMDKDQEDAAIELAKKIIAQRNAGLDEKSPAASSVGKNGNGKNGKAKNDTSETTPE